MFDRRAFFRLVTVAANGLAALLLGVPGVRFLLSPLRRRTAAIGFVAAVPVDDLPAEVPSRVTLQGERRDAFIVHPSSPLGSVFLLQSVATTGSKTHSQTTTAPVPTIRCLHTACPHLGCAIQYSAERRVFECPCHASAFDLSGKVLSGPSPRPMDELAYRVSPHDASGKPWIEVQYQRFRAGTPERIPLS